MADDIDLDKPIPQGATSPSNKVDLDRPIPQPVQEPDTSFDATRTAKQFGYGGVRTLIDLAGMLGQGAEIEGSIARPGEAPTLEEATKRASEISESAKGKLGLNKEENQPRNLPERLSAAAGGGAASSLVFPGPFGALGNMIVGGVAGGAGQGGREAAGSYFEEYPQFKPYAEATGDILGSLIGGISSSRILDWGKAAVALARGPARIGAEGIPVTRGVATGDPEQQSFEEAARRGAYGESARSIITGADARTRAAVDNATRDISQSLGGEPVVAGDAAANVSDSLTQRAQEFHDQATDFYRAAANKDAWIEGARHVDDQVATRLAADNFDPSQIIHNTYGTYPASSNGMRILSRLSNRVGPTTQPIRLTEVEDARQGLNKLRPVRNSEDERAVVAIKRSFDSWTQDAIDQALIRGDATAIEDLRNARSLWSQYLGLVRARTGDDASGVIARIIDRNNVRPLSPAEVTNMIFSMNSVGSAGTASRVAQRIRGMFGADSETFQSMRQEAFLRAMLDPEVTGAEVRNRGTQAMASSLDRFVNGTGSSLAAALFTPDELARMRGFVQTLRRITVPIQNPSGTAGQYARWIWPIMQGGWGLATLGASYELGDKRIMYLAAAPMFVRGSRIARAFMAANARPVRPAPGDLVRTIPGMASSLGFPQGQ